MSMASSTPNDLTWKMVVDGSARVACCCFEQFLSLALLEFHGE